MTASNIRIHRSASCASVAPGGHERRAARSTAASPALYGTPEKRLPLVERLALAIEAAVIVGGEHRVGAQLAGEQPAGQRHAREDADLPRRASGRTRSAGLSRNMLKMICTALDARVAHRRQRLVHRLDADAVVAQLARAHEVVEDAEHLGLS